MQHWDRALGIIVDPVHTVSGRKRVSTVSVTRVRGGTGLIGQGRLAG